MTRVGVFPYRRADGSEILELRPPEEVMDWRSLDTLRSAPVTDGHPKEEVTPENAGKLEIGVVSSYGMPAGLMVGAELSIRRADAIERVEKGELFELSCGYSCDIDPTPGTWNGQRYDAVQRNIRYNHVALGPRGWARLGRDMSLRLDAADAVAVEQADDAQTRADSQVGPGPAEGTIMKKIRIDGVEYDAPEATASAVEKVQTQREELRARADAADAKVTQLEAALSAERDPKKRADEVRARVALEKAAAKVLGDEDVSTLSDRDVRVKAIAKANANIKLDGESDDYVRAMFTALVVNAAERNDGLAIVGAAVNAAGRTAPERSDALDKEIEEFHTRHERAWLNHPEHGKKD